ncbi:adenosylcobinamide kinase/adenosylcobinamide phosphate guanyltransferase [Mycobacterium sp. IS-1496]|uniref:bifunctional adenosylcobinamide kinase/adenosylcobinamide-phosphate guanylyltransferase n=1 Tax=Mycobacterium sp. IS-1496 TaxID=1772284 RepID=UPI0007414ECB|nr:bifunctional adenosylcobinamide kinase/adenosylcobinamide-phosphate guanylyltransferase [Mycobacterium sp. IS-1496]KUI25937.1 adenosylcobinamide kinase/adenosylcobinamide phosphate guanyltransferase [Mycobacterium sp. IS-1496]
MRTLVLGGIRSGKSQWAETEIAAAAQQGPVRYVATGALPAADDEWSARVAAHRRRRPGDWLTTETTDVPAALRDGPATATLVDDIGGWLTAEMDRCDAWNAGSAAAGIDALVAAVAAFTAPLALVSPEVGLTVVPATPAGRRFADELGALNQRLAATCERVVLIVAGQPITVKEPS